MKLSIGDKAPIFSLKNQEGKIVNLNYYIGKNALVVYFYPKNFTPGCVAEACSFRDHFEEFIDVGAKVIGISSDSVSSHARFAKKYKLPFIMLSDKEGHVKKMYDIQGKHISEALRIVNKICNE